MVLEALCRDVACQRAEGLIDFILVSGDLAFSGRAEEYALVGQFFDGLAAAAEVERERIYCIPGNHDIDRDRQEFCFRGARVTLSNPSATDAFLSSPLADNFLTLLQRQDAYRDFERCYFAQQGRTPTEDGLGYVSRLTIDGISFAILGLDSTWLSAGGSDDHLHLLLGERQVLNAVAQIKETVDAPHIVVAMAHHPLHLLQDFDRRSVQARLDEFCHFLHVGHLHSPENRPTGNTAGGCLTLGAGAAFQTRYTQNAYSLVALDLVHGLRTVTIRHYSAAERSFSAGATNDYRIEVTAGETCDFRELAATITNLTSTAWPHYVASLLLAKKTELPVAVSGGHALASCEVIEAQPDGDLKRMSMALLTFRNVLGILLGRETLGEILQHHGDPVREYCAMLADLSDAEPSLVDRLNAQEQDALSLAGEEGSKSLFYTAALLKDLASAGDWDTLREQAERHLDSDSHGLAIEAQRMLALALANSPDSAEKAGAIDLYRRLVESAPPDPTDVGNLATLLAETGATQDAEAVLLRGVVACPPERLDYLSEVGHRIVEATGDKEFRERLRAAIAQRPHRER